VAAPSLLFTLLQGALSLLVSVAILELYTALRDRRDGAAGMWLLVASLKSQVALTSGIALLAGRRWRTLLVGGRWG
jgi:hypothetical protein